MSHTKRFALTPIAAAISATLAAPAVVLAQEEGAFSGVIEEVIVTARKRSESVQDIPSSIQALPEQMLKDMGALNTEDYARFIPSVNWISRSTAGNNQIIFRGVNTGIGNFIATSSSSVYLDEVTTTATNGSGPNIRLMDVARVEALAGPQGTLFGASAQAGTLRIITNKPDPSKFEMSFDATAFTGSDSDPSHNVTGVLNIPIVEDVFAIRIAIQTAEDGGFIDNVLGHTPDGWNGATSGVANNVWPYDLFAQRQEWGTLDNAAVVQDNWNTVKMNMARVSARWDINDSVVATLAYNYSDTRANGGNDYNPFVGDLETIAFTKNYRRDEWDLLSLTIEADLGFAQFVSATSFFDRQYDYSIDGTMYYKYWMRWMCEDRGATPLGGSGYFDNPNTGRAVYYGRFCVMPTSSATAAAGGGDFSQQADFIGTIDGPSWQDRFAQEFRLSHQGETFDWLVGLYYENSNDNWDSVWMSSQTNDYQDTDSLAHMEAFYSDPANCVLCGPGTTFPDAEWSFLSTDRTNWEQKAVFGEITWHINDAWHATIGGRWFETKNEKQYLKYHTGYTRNNGKPVGGILQPDWQPGQGGSEIAKGKIDEFVPKVNVAWHIDDDKMVYAAYTEGFRTGGTNRTSVRADWSITLFPQTWEPDKLKNYEVGAKTRWADGTVQVNLTYFYMDWEDFQTEVVDPSSQACDGTNEPICGNPWLKIVGNSGDAHTSGVTAELAWVPAEGWDVGANAQWLEAEVDENVGFNSGIVDGLDLPNVPEFQGSVWASYHWPVQFISGGEMFVRGQYSYTGETNTMLIPAPDTQNNLDSCCRGNPSFGNDSYGIGDIRFGLISNDGGWQVDFFVNNLTDERAQTYQGSKRFEYFFSSTGEYDRFHRVFTNRPREFGIRYSIIMGE